MIRTALTALTALTLLSAAAVASTPAVAGTALSTVATKTKADDKVDVAECRREYKRGVKFCSDAFEVDTIEFNACVDVEQARFRACMLGSLQTSVGPSATTVSGLRDSVDWVELVVVDRDGSEAVLTGGMPATDGSLSLSYGPGSALPIGTTVRIEQWSGDALVGTEVVQITS